MNACRVEYCKMYYSNKLKLILCKCGDFMQCVIESCA